MKRKEEKKKIDDFRIKLGLRLLDVIMTKEELVLTKIIKYYLERKYYSNRKF